MDKPTGFRTAERPGVRCETVELDQEAIQKEKTLGGQGGQGGQGFRSPQVASLIGLKLTLAMGEILGHETQ